MLRHIQHISFIRGNYVIGVQISFRGNNQNCLYHLIGVKKSRGKLSIVKQIIDITSIEELVKHIPKNTPIVISIDGKNIIHKFFQEDVGDKGLDFVLPNARKEDFYVQTSLINDGAYVSVIRREVIDNVIDRLNAFKVIPALINLGPFVTSCTTFLFDDKVKFKSEFWEIEATGQGISYNPFTSSDSNFIFLNGESIRDFCFPSYALSIAYLADLEIPGIEISLQLKEEFLFKRAVWLGGWFFLSLVFLILLVNFFIFSNYNDKYQDINNMIQQNQSLLNRNDELKTKYTLERRFIERSGLLETSRFSFYADRISRNISDSIQFTAIRIAPVNDKIRSDKPIVFDEKTIIINGKCSNSQYFNSWKDDLKEENWVESILINQFGQEEPGKPIIFELQLMIK
ncbi:MAG TPA: hypothetical protein DIW31_11810 [Bacteroidales bacterium]|nr:hypothetical protein [Bacteroidales bacterium]